MANVKPNQIFPGMSCDGTTIHIPLISLPGLSAEEANGESGNGGELLRVLNESAYQSLSSLVSNAQPKTVTYSKSTPRGQGVDRFKQEYTWGFEMMLNQQSLTMASEV